MNEEAVRWLRSPDGEAWSRTRIALARSQWGQDDHGEDYEVTPALYQETGVTCVAGFYTIKDDLPGPQEG